MSASETDTISEAEVRELFAPRRADPSAFRALVAERIAQRERAAADAAARERDSGLRAHLARRAAALVPWNVSGGGGAVQLALAGMVWPFLVLVVTVGWFFGVRSALARTSRAAVPTAREPSPLTSPTFPTKSMGPAAPVVAMLVQTLAMLAVLSAIRTGSRWAIDALVLCALLTGLGLLWIVRLLAAQHMLTPRTVASAGASLLTALMIGGFVNPFARPIVDAGTEIGSSMCALVLLAGASSCAFVPRPWPAKRALFWCALGWIAFVGLNGAACTSARPDELRAEIARVANSGDPTFQGAIVTANDALTAIGEARVAPPELEREIERALATPAGGDALLWRNALHAGAMNADRWRALAGRALEQARMDQLLRLDGPLALFDQGEYVLAMLVATRELTDAQRAKLVERLESGWPDASHADPIGDVARRVRALEVLGAQERVEARRDGVHELLREHQIAKNTYPQLGRGAFTRDGDQPWPSLETTADAVELLARFGVPDGVDVRALRDHLRGQAARSSLFVSEPPGMRLAANAALLRVERELGLPSRPLLVAIAAERSLIACALLSILVVAAVLSAPRPSGAVAVQRGALP